MMLLAVVAVTVMMLVMVTAAATAVEARSSWSSALFRARGLSIREGGGWQSACMLRLQRHVDGG
jgi:hypothetical protein